MLKEMLHGMIRNNVFFSATQVLQVSLWGNKTQSQLQTSKTSESTGSLSLTERWTITEICRQKNYVLTYFQLTDFLL